VLLLLIGVHLVRRILCQVVELLGVVMHGPSSLLEIHELLTLLPHHACGDVVGAKNIAELSPRHLLVHGASGGVVGPPRAGVTTQLLHGEDGLLHLGTAQEPKFGLHHSKLVIGLEGLSCLGEERRVSGREVSVGDQSWSESIPCSIATMSGVGYELPQQLGLLIAGLKDRGDHLSKLGGGGGFPLPWAFSGPTHPL
jgi:hypothetical protein